LQCPSSDRFCLCRLDYELLLNRISAQKCPSPTTGTSERRIGEADVEAESEWPLSAYLQVCGSMNPGFLHFLRMELLLQLLLLNDSALAQDLIDDWPEIFSNC
jgi:hypothetical protein